MKILSKIISIFLIVLLCAFLIYRERHEAKTFYRIIKVKAPDEFVLDFNGNHKEDEGETVSLVGVSGFENKLFDKKSFWFQKKLTNEDVIKNHYLSMDFLNNNLLNKDVRVELYSSSVKPQAKIYYDGEELSKLLLEKGFAVVKNESFEYKQYLSLENIALIKENAKQHKELDFVIKNKKNNAYHELNCEYLPKIKDYEIVFKNRLDGKEHPCSFCHIKQPEQIKLNDYNDAPPLKMQNLEFYILNFLNHPRPNTECKNYTCKRLLELIRSAKCSIDIAVYSIYDEPKIIDELVKAQKRGVKIRLIVDKKNYQQYRESYKYVEKVFPDFLVSNNLHKKSERSIMHNKFYIFDDNIMFIASANLTKTDVSGFNANVAFVIKNADLAKIYKKEFEQMFAGNFNLNKEKVCKDKIKINDQTFISAYFSPKDTIIEDEIIPIIEKAQKSIYLPVFILTHRDLTKALLDAKQRGVDVKIILDATSAPNKSSKIRELRKNNIPVKVENLAGKMHTKTIIVDDKYVITGSMNFSNGGENYNDENCIIIENPQIAQYYTQYFFKVWKAIPNKWLYRNPRAESFDSIGSCFDGVDNDFDELIDSADTGCQKQNSKEYKHAK